MEDCFFCYWKSDEGYGEEIHSECVDKDDLAILISRNDDIEYFLDRELTKPAKDMDFGYLSITSAYIEATEDDDRVFMPLYWNIYDSIDDCTDVLEPPISLTAEGRSLAVRWLNDYSIGYDLCNGKARGLAAEYNARELWLLIKKESDYHKEYDAQSTT